MKLFFDFFPILIFFISFKIWGIYVATGVGMLASLLCIIFYRIKYNHYDKMQLIGFFILFFLGGATLLFHNPVFIKWKPTGLYWISALAFLFSPFVTRKPLVQTLMEKNITLPSLVWRRLNLAWVVFFMVMGFLNLYVAYYYDTNSWVNFKLFGCTGFTLLFFLLQAVYLSRHTQDEPLSKKSPNMP